MILALSYRNPLDTRTGTTNSGNAARRTLPAAHRSRPLREAQQPGDIQIGKTAVDCK
jgi:hypothetical protein